MRFADANRPPQLLRMTRKADFASALTNTMVQRGKLELMMLHRVVVLGAVTCFKAPRGVVIAHALLPVAIIMPMRYCCVHVVSSMLRCVRHFLGRFGTATCEFHGSLCIRIVQSFPCKSSRTSDVFLCYIGRLGCSVKLMVHRITQHWASFFARCCFVVHCKCSC